LLEDVPGHLLGKGIAVDPRLLWFSFDSRLDANAIRIISRPMDSEANA
jgi:hypothetical protein